MTWSAPWYMILNKFDASTDWSTISSGFLCTNYMDMRSQATNEWMNEGYLEHQHAQSSKQEDYNSCRVYVFMVNTLACCDTTFLSLNLVQESYCALHVHVHVVMFAWGELWMRTVQSLNFFKCIQAAISPHTPQHGHFATTKTL